ncbi:hypothetical protein [Bacillus safensis]|uniref:hypothetical protein n=1 Tax=Bacillus safensis TaxID=561879 RepID=UPI0036527F83
MSSDLHIVYTDNGDEFGWSISSPQIPELVGGRSSLNDLLRDTDSILSFVDMSAFENRYLHEQHVYLDPDGNEYLIRLMDEHGNPERTTTASRLVTAVEWGYEPELRARQPQLVTTERLLIAVIGTDTIGWCFDQLGVGGGAVIAEHRGDDAVYSIPIVDGKLPGTTTWELEELGLTRDDTVDALMDRVLTWEAKGLEVSVHRQPT